jgi:hypothetical protein
MKKYSLILMAILITGSIAAQEETLEKGGFKKENLFTGGGLSLGFANNSFQVGASPFLGYNLDSWIDAGITVNYNYSSYRNFSSYDDKLRRSTYGGGIFTKIYPVNFLFIHAQFEHNFINEKYIYGGTSPSEKFKTEANSFLVGAGYASGRYANSGQPFFYFSLLFDILGNEYSPYTDARGGIIPILRGGVQVPLFQGRNK